MNEDSIAARARVACNCCGCPWDSHPTDTICNRHRPRPAVVIAPAVDDRVSVAQHAQAVNDSLAAIWQDSLVETGDRIAREFVAAYVHESKHPDCIPSHKFHAILPDGQWRPFPTREAAEWALLEAIGSKGGNT